MITIDKRLELLEALVIAVKLENKDNEELTNELDFVEYYDIPYIKDLVKSLHIEKYPKVFDYFIDIEDCGYYTNLYLYFDNAFNINSSFNFKPFQKLNTLKFMELVKEIYHKENIELIFKKYKDYLSNLEKEYQSHLNINFKDNLKILYENVDNVEFIANISLLINGGFSASSDTTVAYIKGIKLEDNKISFNEYDIVCLYHEYSHYFVNKIVDKYYSSINTVDYLYQECLDNYLPKTYHNKKTILYEYIVRANSLILSENQISELEYREDIKWFKEIGFIRINELISIIKQGLNKNLKFESIFKTLILDYFNNLKNQ